MTKEAMKLALEALEKADRHCPVNTEAEVFVRLSITALQKALANEALNKMAENARDLGLDYEPAQLPFGVGGGLVAIKTLLSRDPCVHANTAIQMIDAILAEQPAQQELIDQLRNPEKHFPGNFQTPKQANALLMTLCDDAAQALAEQPAQEPVAYLCENAVGHKYFRWKKPSSTYKPIALYTSPQQPAVPDAIHHTDTSETLEYIQGWNDCRQAMLAQQRDTRNATLDEIAKKIEAMPFGDTAASFAVWIREQRT